MDKVLRTCEIIAGSTNMRIPKGEERKHYDNKSI